MATNKTMLMRATSWALATAGALGPLSTLAFAGTIEVNTVPAEMRPLHVFLQCWITDPAAVAGFAASNALELDMQ